MKRFIIKLSVLIFTLFSITNCTLPRPPKAERYQLYKTDFVLKNTHLRLDGAYAYRTTCDIEQNTDYWGYYRFFKDGRVFQSVGYCKKNRDTIDINTFHLKNKGLWGYYTVDSCNIAIEMSSAGFERGSPFFYSKGTINDTAIIITSDNEYYRPIRSSKRHKERKPHSGGCKQTDMRFINCCFGRVEETLKHKK